MGTAQLVFVVVRPEENLAEVCSAHARLFPALFSYYSSSTNTMATGSDRSSRDPEGGSLGCAHVQQEVADHPYGFPWTFPI